LFEVLDLHQKGFVLLRERLAVQAFLKLVRGRRFDLHDGLLELLLVLAWQALQEFVLLFTRKT
jgi:hypothetical protein